MSKNPSFQFYPNDWRADSVFGCSLAARGLWLEILNMMHASERYGYLSKNGAPIPDESIARYCGCTLQEYRLLLAELERAAVVKRTSDGIIYSKRMVNDQKQRAQWRKWQKNHRDKKSQADVRRMSGSSSSSSSSSNLNIKNNSPPVVPPEKREWWRTAARAAEAVDRELQAGANRVPVEAHCSRERASDILDAIAEAKRRGISADQVLKEKHST